MNTIVIAGYFFWSTMFFTNTNKSVNTLEISQSPAPAVSIIYPKHGQKVRGEIKIYGKAKPGAIVKLHITSTYFKKAYKGERIMKGEGPVKRMNRVFNLTADRFGVWTLKNVDLTNAGWEENFTIKAVSQQRAVSINVYDHTKPVNID